MGYTYQMETATTPLIAPVETPFILNAIYEGQSHGLSSNAESTTYDVLRELQRVLKIPNFRIVYTGKILYDGKNVGECQKLSAWKIRPSGVNSLVIVRPAIGSPLTIPFPASTAPSDAIATSDVQVSLSVSSIAPVPPAKPPIDVPPPPPTVVSPPPPTIPPPSATSAPSDPVGVLPSSVVNASVPVRTGRDVVTVDNVYKYYRQILADTDCQNYIRDNIQEDIGAIAEVSNRTRMNISGNIISVAELLPDFSTAITMAITTAMTLERRERDMGDGGEVKNADEDRDDSGEDGEIDDDYDENYHFRTRRGIMEGIHVTGANSVPAPCSTDTTPDIPDRQTIVISDTLGVSRQDAAFYLEAYGTVENVLANVRRT